MKKKQKSPIINEFCFFNYTFQYLKTLYEPWLVWLSGLSAGLRTKGSPVPLPLRAHAWVAGQVPGWGHVQEVTTDISLVHGCVSPFLSPSLPLSLKNK